MSYISMFSTSRLNETVELVTDMGGHSLGTIRLLPWGVWESSDCGYKVGVFVTRDEAIAALMCVV